MRVPVSSSPQVDHSPNPKLSNNVHQDVTLRHTPPAHNIINNSNNPSLCYEPTSVLDLCRSPSPEKPTHHSPNPQDSLDLEDHHVLHNLDWDSIMDDLGLEDDSTLLKTNLHSTTPCVPEFPPFDQAAPDFTSTLSDIYSNQNLGYNFGNISTNTLDHLAIHDFSHNCVNWNNNVNGFDFIEELIRAADCFDSNNLQLAQVILERLLNQRLRSPLQGKPLHRAALHFRDALQSLLSGSNRTQPPRLSSMVEIVQTIGTFKAFCGISPIPMFSIFTTNQALLEAIHDSNFVHVLDFDIGFGIQYASLMTEMAEKVESCKIKSSPLLRITAVVPEECAVESRLIRENLNQFAHELGIRVQVEFVLLRTFETLSFKAVRFVDGEKTTVLLSPAIFRRLGPGNNIAAFLEDVRRVSPTLVVFVDGEGWTEAAAAASFRRGVVNSLEFYSMMLESLDASIVGEGGGDRVRRIEMHLVRPKILAAAEGAGRGLPPWREAFYGAGMRPVQLSRFADFQAECLLAKIQITGFHVAKRQAELVLCWHERAMVATSAWQCSKLET